MPVVPLMASALVVATTVFAEPTFAAVDHGEILRDRLTSVRELLDRRQAHRTMLTGRIERLSGRLDQLQTEREIALEALADQEDRARAHERELDRLMPRLLPRLALFDRLRKDGARTIAGLAHLERNADLANRARARIKATQTTSIEQMRLASTAVRLLRRTPNAMTAHHRDIDFQIPLLRASASRLDLKQSQLQRRRDAAIRDLADLTVDIERLTAEEHRLARNMIARNLEASGRIDVRSGSVGSVLTHRRAQGNAAIIGADIRGIVLQQTQPTPVARPLDGARARSDMARIAPASAYNAALSAKTEASALLAGWANRKRPWAADVSSLEARPDAVGLNPDGKSGPSEGRQVLVPTIETVGYTAGDNDGYPEIAIAAQPGQPVAAPHSGRVAFAGDFRSYGLLLIIEHGNGYHTLLWGFSSLGIGFGDAIQAGQIVGSVKDGPSPKLHVELRRNGQPVSPEMWLAASNSGVKG